MRVTDEYLIAGDTSAEPELLRKLFQTAEVLVRQRLAENSNSPPDLLELLLHDPDPDVRACLANNPAVTREMLEQLCCDINDDVRASVAEDPNMPYDLLIQLSEDANPYVRDIAENTLDGLAFERELAAQGYVHEEGTAAKLGELLMGANLLSAENADRYIDLGRLEGKPLGWLLVNRGVITKGRVIKALKLQSQVRRGKISQSQAIETLCGSQ